MGFYLGYGLSLFGRDQDRLSHVLVSPEFESHREFFYKPPVAQTLYARTMVGALMDERPVSTDDAKIWLAEIPFVRLRSGLPESLLAGKGNYTDAVQAVQQSLPNNLLVIDIPQRQIICGGIAVKLPPRELAFYAWHARRHIASEAAAITWKDTLGENSPLMAEYFQNYLDVLNGDTLHPDLDAARRTFSHGFEKDAWAGILHHIHKQIRKALGKSRAQPFELQSKRVDAQSRLSAYVTFGHLQ